MCGICGIINFDNDLIQKSDINQMMQVMRHRGPDDEGVFVEENIGLGFVRLSIIDLSSDGHQPMQSIDNRYVIIFNGEIYNYIELREELTSKGYQFQTKTDTEVLLNSYREWGEECLHRFNGMWAFVVYDKIKKTIFGARDRFGVKPFYYEFTKNRLILASEIPAILSVKNSKPKPNRQVIFDYLVFNRTDQTEDTFFEGIKKLQHGHSFTIDFDAQATDVKFQIKRWYNLKEKLGSPFRSTQEFREVFSSAIELRLRSDVAVGVCLSGGLDSSAITSILINDFKKTDINTFSAVYGMGVFGDESKYINIYGNQLRNMNFITPNAEDLLKDLPDFIKYHAEPIPTTSPYAQYKVMELAGQHVVVTMDGQGADEELAGYHYFFGFYFKDLLKHGKIKTLIHEIYNYTFKHKSIFGLKSFIYFMLPKQFRTSARVNEKKYLKKKFVDEHKKRNRISGNLYGANSLQGALLDHFEYKLEHLLKWSDSNSMRFSVESRVPFLDYRLVERLLATPSNMLIKDGMTKHLLRDSMKGILPEEIRLRRDKIGFSTPQDDWFRQPIWQSEIVALLNSVSFNERGFIDSTKALELYYEHLKGNINISKEIWKWIHLEHWFRTFID